MKLDYVQIKNYRSIKDQKIDFKEGCQVLVGINEAGKSNILKALSLLDPDTPITKRDIRIEREDETPTNKSEVNFVFKLDEDEMDEVYEAIKPKYITDEIDRPIIRNKEKDYTLRDFCGLRNEALYCVNIIDEERACNYWTMPSGYDVVEGWRRIKKPSDPIEAEPLGKSAPIKLVGVDFINTTLYKILDGTLFAPITVTDINDLIGREVIKIVERELPDCIYWKYIEQNILPASVNSTTFANNPDMCIPLRSMFELAGYHGSKIGEAITSAKTQSPHIYTNLLKKVSKAATKHLRDVWKDHKTVTIQLGKNGEIIEPMVMDDQISFDFASRSDGFKRFVSFLLMISAKVKTDSLVNTLILVDEPEIGLHPKGAKALMKELIEIGNSNYVVYSTHSIFMIDRDNIERHLIVEKRNETTFATKADTSRVQDEDVLYNAIGFSLFEVVKKENLIFEGWHDKNLFEVVRNSYLKNKPDSKDMLQSLGLTFAKGVKDVKNVAKFLELAGRGCLIISDADNAGKQHKKQYEQERCYGRWVTYSDIFGDERYITGEDFLEVSAIIKRCKKFRSKHKTLPELNPEAFDARKPYLKVLDEWIKNLGLDAEPHKEIISDLKIALFDSLRRDEVIGAFDKVVEYIVAFDFKSTLMRN